MLSFLNSVFLLNQINQVVVIATGFNHCDYIYDSSSASKRSSDSGTLPAMCSNFLERLEEFVIRDEQSAEGQQDAGPSSLLSGSLSMALCCILTQSRILDFFF